jgi:cytochrome c oxidase subunit 2
MIGAHDVLAPAGAQAAHIASLWWIMFWVCVAVFVALMAALAWACWRAPRAGADTPHLNPSHRSERGTGRAVAAAVAVSTLLLFGLLVASIATDRALAQLPRADAVTVHITGHQWWWQVTYDDAQPGRVFATANELIVPVGRPVVATLTSDDVIHSFWVPSLAGKKDLIPGRVATIQLRADKAGEYHAQCAEFCGLQHAYMAMRVVALPPAEFDAWADAQRKPAADPRDANARRGRELFLSGSCMLCHAIRGTTASAHKAPDLTHVASRPRIAAGRLLNDPDDLARWIREPQKIKPGVNMPAHPLADEDLAALVAYMGTLR